VEHIPDGEKGHWLACKTEWCCEIANTTSNYTIRTTLTKTTAFSPDFLITSS
jgi:hypothetical protein